MITRDEMVGKLVRRLGFEDRRVIDFAKLCEDNADDAEWTEFLQVVCEITLHIADLAEEECEKWNF